MYLCFEYGLQVQVELDVAEIKIYMGIAKDDAFANLQIWIPHSSLLPT